MANSRPIAPITDESKFINFDVDGKTVKYAVHDDEKNVFTLKTDNATGVFTVKEGQQLEDGVREATAYLQQEVQQELQTMLFMLKLQALFGDKFQMLGDNTAVLRQDSPTSSPGTSRFGAFGRRDNGSNLPSPMHFSSDCEDDLYENSPRPSLN